MYMRAVLASALHTALPFRRKGSFTEKSSRRPWSQRTLNQGVLMAESTVTLAEVRALPNQEELRCSSRIQ